MPKVRYSNKAVEDLTSIWEYTLSEWSESQADEYYEMLISACNRLLYPSSISNRSYDEITDGQYHGQRRCHGHSYPARKNGHKKAPASKITSHLPKTLLKGLTDK